MASFTPPVSTATPSQSLSASQTAVKTSDPTRKAGIIAGAVIGGLLLVCLVVVIIVPLQRRRGGNKSQTQKQVYAAKAEVEVSAFTSDGTAPLLVGPQAWSFRLNDAEDDAGAAEVGFGPGAEVKRHSRGTSDSTLLIPLVPESGPDAASSYPSNTSPIPQSNNHLRPLSPNTSPIRRLPTSGSVTSHESAYSQASASTRMHGDLAERFTSSPPPPVPALPSQLQLPHIPQTEPIGELLKSRAAVVGPATSENGSPDSLSFRATSIYSKASASTSANVNRQLPRGSSGRTQTSDQPLQSTLRPTRGTPSRSRTVLPNAPMEPLMELDSSGAWSLPSNGTGTERWSSAADPGGSRPRQVALDKEPKRDAETKPENDLPASQPRSSQGMGLSLGLSLLTTAFRKSLSASSTTTQDSSSSSASRTTSNMNALQHYPSVASMGASVTSGAGSGTGSFYTAMSDVGNDSQSVGNRNSGIPTLGRLKKKKRESRTSLSTYPSIPSLASTSGPSRSEPPPVPPLPPLPSSLLSKPIPSLPPPDKKSNSNNGLNPKSTPTPRAKAHLRTPAAHRVRADPHPQLAITRAGRSTHGVIDLVEQ